jgi:hypothetical protein
MKTEEEIKVMLEMEKSRLKYSSGDIEAMVIENRISVLNWVLNNININ